MASAPGCGASRAGRREARRRGLRGRALDRGRLLAADRDAARLARLGLGDADLEHAAVEARGHRLGVDALRQRERAREGAERALHARVALVLAGLDDLALTRDREHGVLE